MYAPPKRSPYTDEGLFDNIVAEVGMIQDLGGNILLTGDFNARTSATNDYVDCRYFAPHAWHVAIGEWLPRGFAWMT